ncbi:MULTISPECIES: cbb3-type cytochrome oxidase assembly protein CcoS [Salipiger]|jgi:cbb3-type cytochrome oxidase maturation protein|uniref:Cytochrome oxidase maturation protein, cbb3-type n=1 Tax=Salipiger bermudensis (strain DSM 26914 / JCM 13377 / KCTC 12554 / HTCC2601) TaxID=314265 RepID=Q0FNJ9_SALBH|nr:MULTISPECIES: cbb3-type cytochrome oxidase assembly protein CcoS [Salipiger]MAE90234.1 cbb3-type cytochrome oxidase assembly protein CcoS [Pelagibaca sp.]MBR9890994.1 cbb3-type cytochrome oxidase assembly protein CcoS [bacterium]EAU45745.1 cytochrome oxidase maturation protein, cbb3-type [Salipiger bermudensis HTCC2601]MBN8187064.1 cbb3-type cytochrome oxidase assembly protein CcoS [Salipiger thiooxidans]MBN9676537.1 cbb3-type cytochrome oxidase assembly protein CcoS [Salipiger bermudensis]
MNILLYLIPISLFLGGMGLLFFVITVRTKQYDDPEGNAARILSGQYDDKPKQD